MFNPYFTDFNNIKHGLYDFRERDILVQKYAWAVPNKDAIEAIKRLAVSLIEVGAGSGYWAKVLNSAGVNIVAYDAFTGEYKFNEQWFNVQAGSIENIKQHADKALFLCWPNYDDPFAYNALREYMRVKGKTFIYVGEGDFGCTGDAEFHKLLSRKWNKKEIVRIPNWNGIHDYMGIYTRD